MPAASTTSSALAQFADTLLSLDLPALPPDRLAATVEFIERRVAVLPSVTRFGVTMIATLVGVAMRVAGSERAARLVDRRRLPLVVEYPRLVRSLGYAYIWETWPATRPDGGPR